MDTLRFFGRVYPAGFRVNARAPQVTYNADDRTLTVEMDVSVVDSEVTVTCAVEGYSPDNLFAVWRHAERVTKGIVDLIAFREGAAATVILDSWADPTGRRDNISFVEPAVQGLVTSLPNDGNFLKVFEVMADEQELLLVLEDLIATLGSQEHKNINCARCVEAVRHLIAGDRVKRAEQWAIMRDKLNVDEGYLHLIMDHSKDHRHGKQTPIDPAIVTEIVRRTWIIIDRFFHFRLGRNERLDLARFPLLANP